MFTCFLIPASPKDIMTYLAGLDHAAWRICLIATAGRIPSIVSSTLAAGFAASGMWGRPSSTRLHGGARGCGRRGVRPGRA